MKKKKKDSEQVGMIHMNYHATLMRGSSFRLQ